MSTESVINIANRRPVSSIVRISSVASTHTYSGISKTHPVNGFRYSSECSEKRCSEVTRTGSTLTASTRRFCVASIESFSGLSPVQLSVPCVDHLCTSRSFKIFNGVSDPYFQTKVSVLWDVRKLSEFLLPFAVRVWFPHFIESHSNIRHFECVVMRVIK